MMKRMLCLVALVCLALPAAAQVVQLVRPRETVLTLQPGSTRALMRETRTLQLPAGPSSLSFTWAGSTVDAASMGLTVDKGAVGDTSRAPGQDRTLTWQVNEPAAGTVTAVVSYFLDGVKWQPSYVLTLDAAKGKAVLETSVRLTNETGAALRQVCLQMGTPGDALAPEQPAATPAILSAVASVEPGATAVIDLTRVPELPATLRYVYQAERSAEVQQTLLLGLEESGLTAQQLPDGPMLIQQAGEPQIPLAKAQLDLQPGKDFEVAMGSEPDIVVERKLLSSKRGNLDFDRFGKVAGLDTTEEVVLSLRNHLDHAVSLDIIEPLLSTWDLKGPEPTKKDASSIQWTAQLTAGGSAELRFSVVKHSGTRAKK